MAPGINFGNTLESMDTWETPPFTVSKETVWGNPAANQTIFNADAAAGFQGIKTYVNYWDGYITYAAIKHRVVPMYWNIGELIDRNTGATKDIDVLNAIISGATTDPEPQTAVGVNGG